MITTPKRFDLEERTERFAISVRLFAKSLTNQRQFSDIDQLIRSSGSVGANYIEANEALGKKDFLMRIRISLKEAKESAYWLRLIDVGAGEEFLREKQRLHEEALSLVKIFGSILRNTLSHH